MVRRPWLWALGLLALGAVACATPSPSRSSASLPLHLIDGSSATWSSLVAAQGPTVVVFATTWCEICRHERPAVQEWARAHRPTPLVYVFSGGDLPADMAQVQAMQLDTDAMKVVVDADGQLADRYAVEATPTILVLGAQGQVLSTSHRFDPSALP